MTSSQVIALITLILFIGVGAGSYIKGKSDGRSAEAAENAEDIRKLSSQLSLKSKELSDAEQSRLRQVSELEQTVNDLKDSADHDATATRPAISLDGVRRLNQVR